MISERLKELDIKIAELSKYISLSRPTLYKLIESYDLNNKKGIKKEILNLFDYIDNNNYIGKLNVIDYIFSHFTLEIPINGKNNLLKKKLIGIISNEDITRENLSFIYIVLSNNDYNSIINFMLKIDKILNKKDSISSDERKYISKYKQILKIINDTVKEENKNAKNN